MSAALCPPKSMIMALDRRLESLPVNYHAHTGADVISRSIFPTHRVSQMPHLYDRLPSDLVVQISQELQVYSFLQLTSISRSMVPFQDLNTIWRMFVMRDYPTWMVESHVSIFRLLRMDHDWKETYTHFHNVDKSICRLVRDVSMGQCLRSIATRSFLGVDLAVAADSLDRLIRQTHVFSRYGLGIGSNARAFLLSIRRRQAVAIWQSDASTLEDMVSAFDLFWLPCADNSLDIKQVRHQLDRLADQFNRSLPKGLEFHARAIRLAGFIHKLGYGDTSAWSPLLANNFMSSMFRESVPGSSPPLTAVLYSALARRCEMPETHAFPLYGKWLVVALTVPIHTLSAEDLEANAVFLNPYRSEIPLELATISASFGICPTRHQSSATHVYKHLETLFRDPVRLRRLFIASFSSYTRRLAKRAYVTDQSGGNVYDETYTNVDWYNSLSSRQADQPSRNDSRQHKCLLIERQRPYPFDMMHYADANYACIWANAIVERAEKVDKWILPLFSTIKYWFSEDYPFAESLFDQNKAWKSLVRDPGLSNPQYVLPTPLESLTNRWHPTTTASWHRPAQVLDLSSSTGLQEYSTIQRRHGSWEPEQSPYKLGSFVVHNRDGHIYVVFRFQWPSHVWVVRGFVHRVVNLDDVREYTGGGLTTWPDGRVLSAPPSFNLPRLLHSSSCGSGTVNDFLRFAGTVFRTAKPGLARLLDWAPPAESGVTVDNLS